MACERRGTVLENTTFDMTRWRCDRCSAGWVTTSDTDPWRPRRCHEYRESVRRPEVRCPGALPPGTREVDATHAVRDDNGLRRHMADHVVPGPALTAAEITAAMRRVAQLRDGAEAPNMPTVRELREAFVRLYAPRFDIDVRTVAVTGNRIDVDVTITRPVRAPSHVDQMIAEVRRELEERMLRVLQGAQGGGPYPVGPRVQFASPQMPNPLHPELPIDTAVGEAARNLHAAARHTPNLNKAFVMKMPARDGFVEHYSWGFHRADHDIVAELTLEPHHAVKVIYHNHPAGKAQEMLYL
jgi:hypothetical protein